MIIRQFLHQQPVGISYLFGCGGRAAGAVVDPVGETEPYMRAAEAAGMRIHFVIDTHVHADHLSAGRQLAEAAGAEYVLAAHAEVSFPFRGARDEEVLPLGNVAATVLHIPTGTWFDIYAALDWPSATRDGLAITPISMSFVRTDMNMVSWAASSEPRLRSSSPRNCSRRAVDFS